MEVLNVFAGFGIAWSGKKPWEGDTVTVTIECRYWWLCIVWRWV